MSIAGHRLLLLFTGVGRWQANNSTAKPTCACLWVCVCMCACVRKCVVSPSLKTEICQWLLRLSAYLEFLQIPNSQWQVFEKETWEGGRGALGCFLANSIHCGTGTGAIFHKIKAPLFGETCCFSAAEGKRVSPTVNHCVVNSSWCTELTMACGLFKNREICRIHRWQDNSPRFPRPWDSTLMQTYTKRKQQKSRIFKLLSGSSWSFRYGNGKKKPEMTCLYSKTAAKRRSHFWKLLPPRTIWPVFYFHSEVLLRFQTRVCVYRKASRPLVHRGPLQTTIASLQVRENKTCT